jgi:hypothetical protein
MPGTLAQQHRLETKYCALTQTLVRAHQKQPQHQHHPPSKPAQGPATMLMTGCSNFAHGRIESPKVGIESEDAKTCGVNGNRNPVWR